MQLNSTVLEIGKYMYIIIILLLPSGGQDSFRNVNCPSVKFRTAKNFEWRVYRVKQQLEYYLHIKLLYLTD
jgi:hypothetical protein